VHEKTLATVYSARARGFAGVPKPFRWNELEKGLKPQDFTLPTVLKRLHQVGDLWETIMTPKAAELGSIFTRIELESQGKCRLTYEP
jgi:bifunctional non-homologous end joining protein LigD